MDLDVRRGKYGEQTLDDLQLHGVVHVRSVEALTNRFDYSLHELLFVYCGHGRHARRFVQIAVRHQFLKVKIIFILVEFKQSKFYNDWLKNYLYAVESYFDNARRLAFTRGLKWKEIFFGVVYLNELALLLAIRFTF